MPVQIRQGLYAGPVWLGKVAMRGCICIFLVVEMRGSRIHLKASGGILKHLGVVALVARQYRYRAGTVHGRGRQERPRPSPAG